MTERVEPIDLGITWSPASPDAVLVCLDIGPAALAMRADPADGDQRVVLLQAVPGFLATMGPPNDEGIHKHRLYGAGLDRVLWAGEVFDSSRVARMVGPETNKRSAGAAAHTKPRHFVLLLKEAVVEFVCDELRVSRSAEASTVDAAIAWLATTQRS